MHNLSANPAPSAEIHNVMHEKPGNFLGIVVSDLSYLEVPPYLVVRGRFNQCLIFRQDVLEIEKCAVFGWEGDLMNRLIHRSWGKGFVNIFLDLSINISHFSSQLISVHWEERRFSAFPQVLPMRHR